MKNEKLEDEIEVEIQNTKSKVSMIIKDIKNNQYLYRYNEEQKVISASIIKVPIMLAVLEKVRLEKITLNQKQLVAREDILEDTEVFEEGEKEYTIKELLNWMIINSDNTATNILIKLLGMDWINYYIKETLKLENTKLQRLMLDEKARNSNIENYTTQEDMLKMFENLYQKRILTPNLCEIAIQVLKRQRKQNQIMRYIYEDVEFAHKTGALDYLNHDVGVMELNNKEIYIGVSVYDCERQEGDRELVGRIGKIIYEKIKE